ncbi:hypothetical protein SAMN05421544_101272 [Riemerella columbipharyngis]|uniref:Outer membrane protein beta-barrel family protein n=1 Tax=Riemerella columbipharyngis TaxID=1071918 RepID=A0A1G6YVF6_9FLAO|nr:hypothetical protein SAMN05421544_101272 [Riemerella columbipharyngis]
MEKAQVPSIPENRYLMNNVHYLSANFLTSPFKDKDWEAKVNASYSNNAIEREDYRELVYGDDRFSSRIKNHFYNNRARGEVVFTKNADKGFFKNVTTWNSFWDDSRAFAQKYEAQRDRESHQSNHLPTSSFENSLSAIIPIKEKLLNVRSYINVKNDRQSLIAFPANYSIQRLSQAGNYEDLKQDLSIKNVDFENHASMSFSLGRWTFSPGVGLNINRHHLQSQLYGINGNFVAPLDVDYQNNMEWNDANTTTQVEVNYKNNAFSFYATLPVNFYTIHYKKLLRSGKNRTINKTVFEPDFFCKL